MVYRRQVDLRPDCEGLRRELKITNSMRVQDRV